MAADVLFGCLPPELFQLAAAGATPSTAKAQLPQERQRHLIQVVSHRLQFVLGHWAMAVVVCQGWGYHWCPTEKLVLD